MKQFLKNHIYLTKKSLILIPILIFLTGFYLLFYTDLPEQFFWANAIREKHHFTNRETSLISDVIHIRCNTIEEMVYSHGKDTAFIIYISDFEEEDLNINYTKKSTIYNDNGIIYEENNTNKIDPITCNFEKYGEQDVLRVVFRGWDSTLYKIVPQSPYVILGFICLMCLILFLIFLIIKIKNEKKSLMNKSQK